MRTTLLLFVFISSFTSAFAQFSPKEKAIKSKKVQHIEFDQEELTKDGFLFTHYTKLGLSSPEELVERRTIKDLAGWNRIKCHQQYNGLEVIGSQYTLHEKNGVIKRATGNILPHIDLSSVPTLAEAKASTIAQEFYENYLYQKTGITAPTAWQLSKPELVIMDRAYPEVSGNYALTYKIILSDDGSFNQPIQEVFYIDAHTGRIIDHLNLIAHTSVEGLAKTKFYGEKVITTDSIAPDTFLLRDETRGDGIVTLKSTGEDFIDEDNYWDNFNATREEVGGDAHYCSISHYDFMDEKFDWEGADGFGMPMYAYVFGTERNYVNAFWRTRVLRDGQTVDTVGTITLGSGDCDQYDPLTTLTVTSHEWTHGFTQYSSGLIYRSESGALNESMSDIFGKAVEYEYDFDNFEWLIGDKFLVNPEEDQPFRNMEDPHLRSDPKLYGGDFWQFGEFASVHNNSGVFNHWFYLLVEGVEGVNEVGFEYNVPSIGMEKALQIAYSLNSAYLLEGSGYVMCMHYSLQVCDDLFGPSSMERAAVEEAWRAVGIDPRSAQNDIAISLPDDRFYFCNSDSQLEVEFDLINTGLETIPQGTAIELSYDIAEVEITRETLVLSEDFMPGDTVHYEFMHVETLPDNSTRTEVVIHILSDEYNQVNNSFEVDFQRAIADGLELEVTRSTLERSNPCNLNQDPRFVLVVRNNGCEVFPTDTFQVVLMLDEQEIVLDLNFNFEVQPGSLASASITLDRELFDKELFEYAVSTTNMMISDGDLSNNSLDILVTALDKIRDQYLETFEPTFDPGGNVFLSIDPDFNSVVQTVNYDGESMIAFSGRDTTPSGIEECTDEEIFFRENRQITDVEFCIDATGMMKPTLAFDLVQFTSEEVRNTALPPQYGAMLRVTIDGEQMPLIFGQAEGELVHHEFELPAIDSIPYQGTVLMEFLNLEGSNDMMITEGSLAEHDYNLLDNLQLYDNVVSTNEILTNDYKVFPNPSSGLFTFKNTVQDQKFEITIFDSVGRTMASLADLQSKGTWDASSFDDGIYFYTIEQENGKVQNGKIVLQR